MAPEGSLIERVSSADLTTLVTDVGAAPMQVGAVLFLSGRRGVDVPLLERTLGDRIDSIPRMRQQLVAAPPGCGRPVWVDDADFDLARHLEVVRCPSPGDRRAALDLAADLVVTRLDRQRPLWSALIVTDLLDGEVALVVVFHHVLADGIGGLAMLANLVDGAVASDRPPSFPAPAPRARALASDAVRSRIAGVRRLPATLRALARALGSLRSRSAPHAASCSLNRRTGPRRRLAHVQVDLQPVVDAAHAEGATVNDVLLAALTAALRDLLEGRGESVDRFVVSIPVARRQATTVDRLGNSVSAVPVDLVAVGDPSTRLREVAAVTRAAKQAPNIASVDALMGPAFRALARLGLFGWFIGRQRMVHTFVTNLRGPAEPMQLTGVPITEVMAMAVVPGNVTVSFAVLSYAGRIGITIVADPDTCPDLDALEVAVGRRLAELAPVAVDRKERTGPP